MLLPGQHQRHVFPRYTPCGRVRVQELLGAGETLGPPEDQAPQFARDCPMDQETEEPVCARVNTGFSLLVSKLCQRGQRCVEMTVKRDGGPAFTVLTFWWEGDMKMTDRQTSEQVCGNEMPLGRRA